MGFLSRILSNFHSDLGIDLGTANTLVFSQGVGVMIQEPSVVAIDTQKNMVLAVGDEAKKMIGRTPGNVIAVRPLRDGVIADFDVTETMLKYFIKKALPNRIFNKPRIIVGVPSGITGVEKTGGIRRNLQRRGARSLPYRRTNGSCDRCRPSCI